MRWKMSFPVQKVDKDPAGLGNIIVSVRSIGPPVFCSINAPQKRRGGILRKISCPRPTSFRRLEKRIRANYDRIRKDGTKAGEIEKGEAHCPAVFPAKWLKGVLNCSKVANNEKRPAPGFDAYVVKGNRNYKTDLSSLVNLALIIPSTRHPAY